MFTIKKIQLLWIFVLVFLVASGDSIAIGNGKLAQKLTTSFSKLNHITGLTEAEYSFNNNLLRNLLKQGTIQQSIQYSTQSNSKGTVDFSNRVLDIFNANHGLRNSVFKLVDTHIDEVGHLHVIASQYINGIRVEVSKIAIHFDSSGTLLNITGQHMSNQNISTIPQISVSQSVEFAKSVIVDSSSVNGTPELVLLDEKLVYLVNMSETGVPGWWMIVVDAQTGEVLEKQSSVCYLNPPGFPNNGSISQITGNIVTHEEATSGELATVNGWQDNTDSRYYLFNSNEHWQVVDSNARPAILFKNASNNWGTTSRQAISIARNIKCVQSFNSSIFGYNSFDGNGAMAVCYYRNSTGSGAYWSGTNPGWFVLESGMSYGGGSFLDLVVLDVIAHEFGHAINQYHSHLPPNSSMNESAALNETYGDITGSCIESYFQTDGRDQYIVSPRSIQAKTDWLMGEDISRNSSGSRFWLRNIREPLVGGLEGNHPSFYKGTSWRSDGEPHTNSTVGSFAFYLISEGVNVESVNDPGTSKPNFPYGPFRGLGIDAARNIAWGAQFDGVLLSNADYFACRNAWLTTAKSHGYDAGIVAQAWAAVGVINRTVNKPSGVVLPANPPNYTSISAALSAASNGDLIYVFPGTYTGNLTINRSNLTLVSRNRDLATIDGTVTLASTADGVTITGFTIDASSTTDGIVLSGTSGDRIYSATISGNRFQNCRNGIMANYVSNSSVCNSQFQSCAATSVSEYDCSYFSFFDSKINTTGAKVDRNCSGSLFYSNRLENVTNTGIIFTGTGSSSDDIGFNEFMNISGTDISGLYPVSTLFMGGNVISNPNTFTLNFPSGTTGWIARNTFNPRLFNISAPSGLLFYNTLNEGNFWNNYAGVDNNGDGKGDTYLPHLGLDYYPFIKPRVSAIHFKYGGSSCLASSVCGYSYGQYESFRSKGTVKTGTLSGLKFSNAASISTTGDVIGSQTLICSNAWLDNTSNLTGGLVLKDAAGKAQMCISSGGIIRTRGAVSPLW
jgi:Zn-dependent metalloprotease